jgi:hypothetical protein
MEDFDITIRLVDVAQQPKNEEVMEWLQNRYRELGRYQRHSFFNSRRDALTEELYCGGIRFKSDLEIYECMSNAYPFTLYHTIGLLMYE